MVQQDMITWSYRIIYFYFACDLLISMIEIIMWNYAQYILTSMFCVTVTR